VVSWSIYSFPSMEQMELTVACRRTLHATVYMNASKTEPFRTGHNKTFLFTFLQFQIGTELQARLERSLLHPIIYSQSAQKYISRIRAVKLNTFDQFYVILDYIV
jgi:hypothetical protein